VGTWEGGNVGTDARPRPVRRFEDLDVWQTARQLAMGVYRAARTQALRSDSSLKDQMKRSAVSISSNIAEGYERGTRKQHIEFCYTAKGSAGEPRSQVIVAHDTDLLTDEAFKWLMEHCEKCSSQLARYLLHLQKSQGSIRGVKFVDQTGRNGRAKGAKP
jgi:four helix bundle protein